MRSVDIIQVTTFQNQLLQKWLNFVFNDHWRCFLCLLKIGQPVSDSGIKTLIETLDHTAVVCFNFFSFYFRNIEAFIGRPEQGIM